MRMNYTKAKCQTVNLVIIVIIITFYILLDIFLATTLGGGEAIVPFVVIQLLVFLVAISPFGENVLRLIYKCRGVLTNREKEALLPLFESVYDDMQEEFPEIQEHGIQLYIDDSGIPNAFALGRGTIAVSKGALEIMTQDELRGILAHELGHLTHYDTFIPLTLIVGNVTMFIFMLVGKFALLIGKITESIIGNRGLTTILEFLGKGIYAIFVGIFTLIIMAINRQAEYWADEFAVKIGYGTELVNALYKLNNIGYADNLITIIDRLKSSHPMITQRIAKLESFIDEE